MILVGESLNSSIPEIQQALKAHDEAYMVDMILRQEAGGADYLDINAAVPFDREAENMAWLLGLVLKHSSCGISLDAASPELMMEFLPKIKDRKLIINSVTLEDRYERLIAAARERGAKIVGLPLSGGQVPDSVSERLENAEKLIEKLKAAGFQEGDIFIDALVRPISFYRNAAIATLETIRQLKARFPGVKTVAGISNISYGLPSREKLNAVFLAMAMQAGLDCAICNLTAYNTAEVLRVCNALLGWDAGCLEYIKEEK